MAKRKRTPEQNREIYRRRVERARAQGFTGYSQKRYQTEKKKKLEEVQRKLETQLEQAFPGLVMANQLDLTPDRQFAYDRLVNSKLFTEEELDRLRNAEFSEFWSIARPMLNRLSP